MFRQYRTLLSRQWRYFIQTLLSRYAITIVIFTAVMCFFIWAWNTPIEIFVHGSGKVTSHSDNKVIEHLEGGILTHVYAVEGQQVELGTILFTVDNPSLGERIRILEEQLLGKASRVARLLAEMNGNEFSPLSEIRSPAQHFISDYYRNEINLYHLRKTSRSDQHLIIDQQIIKEKARLQEIRQTIIDLQNELGIAKKQRDILELLLKGQAGSLLKLLEKRMEVLRIQTRVNQSKSKLPIITAQIDELVLEKNQLMVKFKQQVQDEYNQEVTEVAQIEEQLTGAKQRRGRRDVRSPVTGTLHRLHTSTVGEVVSPGSVMAEIVPENEPLLIEARVAPYDRARIWAGQEVNLRVSAYNYAIYGTLNGRITEISADTYQDEFSSQFFYQIMIKTNKDGFGLNKPLIQGMTVDVNIVSGKQSILTYLLPPVFSSVP